MRPRSPWLCFSLWQGLKEAGEQVKRCSQAARNTLPGLQSADGVDLGDVDDGSQGFQSGAAALADLPRQSASVKLSTGHTECYNPFPKQPETLLPAICPMPGAAQRRTRRVALVPQAQVPPKATSPPAQPPAGRSFPKPPRSQHHSPQHRRSPSELSSPRLKQIWTSMRCPHLLFKPKGFFGIQSCPTRIGDGSSIPRPLSAELL